MRLYRVPTPGGAIWYGTQAGAKLGAKEFRNDWELIEVPTDKEGLLDWLNARTIIDGHAEDMPEEDPLHAAEQRAIAEAQRTPDIVDAQAAVDKWREGPGKDINRVWDATDIEAFILDRATVAQVSSIFACLGTRFKEQVNEASNL